uniref:28S rRNA (uridine-N(3))-methyltransferase n=1 Tax=Pipistrellus kuhlii TaxID=59472 RepID=A0A7J7S3X6_PIPKU|nr:SPOUT domain containing methyltransferase 1 [Pipistrellus kuhlii]
MEAAEERGEEEVEGSQADEKTGAATGARGTDKAPAGGRGSCAEGGPGTVEGEFKGVGKKGQACVQLARILQYLECPQYLRKAFFPKHQDLQFAGLLNPLDSPHHMRQDEESEFREGVVVDRPTRAGQGSFVNCGMKKEVKIDKNLEPGLRVTVRLSQQQLAESKTYRGKVVSSQDPRTKAGLYWGYTVRLASCLSAVFAEAPFQDGYDLTIGTSERGSDVASAQLPSFRHALVVFGGLQGLEAGVNADPNLEVTEPSVLFDLYVNTCPSQGSRTIRTEEAILISLAALQPGLTKAGAQRKVCPALDSEAAAAKPEVLEVPPETNTAKTFSKNNHL